MPRELRSRFGIGARRMLLSHASFGKPVFLTMLHMMTSCTVPVALAQTRLTAVPAQTVTRAQSLRIAALAVVFAASVVAGNLGLSLVHVSFFQVSRKDTASIQALARYAPCIIYCGRVLAEYSISHKSS